MNSHVGSSVMEASCGGVTPMTEARSSSRKVYSMLFGRRRHEKVASVDGCDVTQLSVKSTAAYQPTLVRPALSGAKWMNRSLPPQPSCRLTFDDDTPLRSKKLQRGRPNSPKCGLVSPLQQSLMMPTDMAVPVVCTKEAAVIDTSPIISHLSSPTEYKNEIDHATDGNLSTVLHDGSPVSLVADIEATQDESAHNQAFTESMLAEPSFVDCQSIDYEAKDGDLLVTETDTSTRTGSGDETSVMHGRQLSGSCMTSSATDADADTVLLTKLVQSSTASLDSGLGGDHMNQQEGCCIEPDLGIPRSFSKQSIVSHDSGVSLSDVRLVTRQSTACSSPTSHSSQFSRAVGVRKAPGRQSVRFSPNLRVSCDVQSLLSKARVHVEAITNAEKDVDVNSVCHVAVSSSVQSAQQRQPSLSQAHSSSSQRPSKRVPVLPISTNLLRVSYDYCLVSGKEHEQVTNAPAAVTASPTVAVGPPHIKSALLTPSFSQCMSGGRGTAQLRTRFRGKPVKRLQSSPHKTHSPINPLSPYHVSGAGHSIATAPVPFDLDI